MTPDQDVSADVVRLRDKVVDMELSTTKELGEIKAAVRIAKHDAAQWMQQVSGLSMRMDRFETQFKADLKEATDSLSRDMRALGEKVAGDVRTLTAEISTNNTESQKKFSFYAGAAAAVTFSLTVVVGASMAIYKALFG